MLVVGALAERVDDFDQVAACVVAVLGAGAGRVGDFGDLAQRGVVGDAGGGAARLGDFGGQTECVERVARAAPGFVGDFGEVAEQIERSGEAPAQRVTVAGVVFRRRGTSAGCGLRGRRRW